MQHLWAWLARLRGPASVSSVSPHTRPLSRVRLEVEKLEERSIPAVIGTGTGLTGQYFSDTSLGKSVLTRTDPQVNFATSTLPVKVANLAGTKFSVRWTGSVQAQFSETYTFSTLSDDGVRLIVNGQQIINDWTDHSSRTDSGSITLNAGQKYAIEMDFYQDLGVYMAQLSWASPSTARQVVPTSQLYPTASQPVVPVAALAAPNVTAAGTSQTFSVTYSDSLGINASTLTSGDVRVTGPNGFSQLATLVSVSSPTATQKVATYRITAPGGNWDAADNGTYTVSQIASEVKDTAGTAVPAGTLGTFTVNVPAAVDWFSQNLHDATLTSLTRSLDADHSLSRSDMLAIFQQVEKDGQVTTTELGDLRTLVANAGPLGMPDPVRDLAGKVVNGDPANAAYLGKPLGNLTAGATTVVLQDLVNKWFLGLDHPATDSGLTYQTAAGTLFGSGPSYTNVVQGTLNDCYLLAGAAAVAYRDPSALQNDFINNGDGTWTVRFFNNGVADYVTVDSMLPATSGGAYEYANFQKSLSNTGNTLWVALLEKAYAQLSASGWTRGNGLANAYASINFGSEGAVIEQLTGLTMSELPLFNVASTLTSLSSAVQSGKMVCIDSNATTASGIVADHVYVVLSYNATTQTFNTYNPWGYTQQLTWSQVASNFDYWTTSN